MHFGKKGNGEKEFNTAHGMTLDTRYEPARLLICDRNHQPKGRLLHYSLEGEFIGEVIGGLGMRRLWLFKANMFPSRSPRSSCYPRQIEQDHRRTRRKSRPKKGGSYNVPQSEWIEGVFSGTHGSYWDKDGNLYVQDWNVAGRIMKLVRAKAADAK